MSVLQDLQVVTDATMILTWNGITAPEVVAATADKPQRNKYSIAVAFNATTDASTYAELYSVCDQAKNEAYPRGAPSDFAMPFGIIKAEGKGAIPELAGLYKFGASTYDTPPTVLNADGRELSAAEYGPMLYAGCKVRAIVKPWLYDVKGKTGASFNILTLLIVDANKTTAPTLSVAAGGISAPEAAKAFGIQPGAAAALGTPPAPGAAPALAPPPAAPAPVAPAPTAPAPVAPNAAILTAAPPAGIPQPPAPPGAVAAPPAPAAPQRQMTATATATYDAYTAAGWNDKQLIDAGHMIIA